MSPPLLALNYCFFALQLPTLSSELYLVHSIHLGTIPTLLFYEFVRFTMIGSGTRAAGRQGFWLLGLLYLRSLRQWDILLGHSVYYTVVAKSRREASQGKQGLFLFSLPLPPFGG